MVPTGAFAAAVLLALIPGWVFLKLRERRDAALPRNGLDEVLEIFAVGLSTTGAAVLVWLLVPHSALPCLLDPQTFADQGASYLSDHVRRTALTFAAIFGLALLAAAIAAVVTGWKTKSRFARVTVWTGAFAGDGDKLRWIGLHLRDGRHVEGQLLAYPTGDEHERRDIALAAPIYVTDAPDRPRRLVTASRLVLNEVDVKSISLTFVVPPPKA